MPPRTAGYMLDRRQAILAAARECFAEIGVLETGMADIAHKAGTSAGALYKHFASRDEVLEAVLSETIEGFYRNPIGRSWNDLRNVLLGYALLGGSSGGDNALIQRAIYGQSIGLVALSNPALRKQSGDAFERAERWLTEDLERLHGTGEIKLSGTAESAARHLIDLVTGCAVSIAFRRRDPADLSRELDNFVGAASA